MINQELDLNSLFTYLLPMLTPDLDYWTNLSDCKVTSSGNIEVVVDDRVDEDMIDYFKDQLCIYTTLDGFISSHSDGHKISFEYSVPVEWESDFSKVINGEISNTSDKFKSLVKKSFSKLDKDGYLYKKFK